jgi:hypothetical protein
MNELARFAEELGSTIEARKTQLESFKKRVTHMEGEIQALIAVKSTMESRVAEASAPPPAPVVHEPTEFEKEVERRKAEGVCTFKSRISEGGKWCEKKLRSKAQKESGYCKSCMEEVNG